MFAIQKKLKNEEYPNKNRYFEITWKYGFDDVTLVMDNVTWVKIKLPELYQLLKKIYGGWDDGSKDDGENNNGSNTGSDSGEAPEPTA